MERAELIGAFGKAMEQGRAAAFVGAGLSQASKLPGWSELLSPLQLEAQVPTSIQDLPLVAEYIATSLAGGRERLEAHVHGEVARAGRKADVTHQLIVRSRIADIWTTNYDLLLEEAAGLDSSKSIFTDADLATAPPLGARRIIHMHGGIAASGTSRWAGPPTLTRSDYETYEGSHQRLWALLRATYLTQSFLFVGFSFDDPNISVLLKISRQLEHQAPRHYAVMTRPLADHADERRLHDLRVSDLEKSGIHVYELDSHGELPALLADLELRSRPARLFACGGSGTDPDRIDAMARAIGGHLADWSDLELTSLASPPLFPLAWNYGNELNNQDRYRPELIQFNFRRREGGKAPGMSQRTGMAIYTNLDRPLLPRAVIGQCRAVLVIGGGDKTGEEVTEAREQGLPVLPIPLTGGHSDELYAADPDGARISARLDRDLGAQWRLLSNPDPATAARAASRILGSLLNVDQHSQL